MGQLDGKVAVITGGASGIGAGTCRLFVEQGARVVVSDILDAEGQKLVTQLGAAAIYVHTDVTCEADLAAVVATATERFGRLDCMFNNAGAAGIDTPIADTDAEGLQRTVALLFNAVVLGIKHAAPIMRAQGAGSIVNTASVAGLQAGFGPHVYSAMKAAVIQLTRTVATELGEQGIRVNCICPGGIVTPIFGRSLGLDDALIQERTALLNEPFAAMQPIRRPGQPRDIAQAVLWLASDASSFVNGHALVVDGGLTAGRGWSETLALFDGLRERLGAPPREQS